jgi:hypothetical protein
MKLAIATGLMILTLSSSVLAQGYNRGHGHYHNGGGNWVAPLVGGVIIGGIIGSMASPPPPPVVYVAPPAPQYVPPTCWDEIVGYDAWGRPVYRRYCR